MAPDTALCQPYKAHEIHALWTYTKSFLLECFSDSIGPNLILMGNHLKISAYKNTVFE